MLRGTNRASRNRYCGLVFTSSLAKLKRLQLGNERMIDAVGVERLKSETENNRISGDAQHDTLR